MKKTRLTSFLLLVLTLLSSIFILSSCGGNDHTHNYSIAWVKDGSYHWQACSGCEDIRNKAEHDWNSGVVTLPPTNTSEGERTYTCNTCGHTRVESIPILGVHEHTFSESWSSNETHHWHAATCEHSSEKKDNGEHNWSSGVVTTEPTTASTGVKIFTCQLCGKTKTEDVPKIEEGHAHVYNQKNTNKKYISSVATCTEKATYFYSCTCGLKGTETFEYGEASGHQYSSAWSYNDTNHWHAATCKHSSEKKDNSGHDWDSGVVTTEPTTTSKGVKTFTCEICNNTKTEDIPTLEEVHSHVYNQRNTDDAYLNSEATCTAKATYFYSCSCGLKGTETFEYGSLAAHTFTLYISNGNATCTKDGTKTSTCEVCKTAIDEIVDIGSAKGHTYSSEWLSDDTHHWHSSTCGHTSETSSKETHHWDAGVVTKQPTETIEGEKTYTCDVCKKTKVDNIGKLDHIHTYDSKYTFDDNYHWYAATCVHTSEVKAKVAHRWNVGVITSEATVYDEGVKLYTCQDCEHIKEESIAKIFSFTVVFYDADNKIISKNNYELNTVSSQIVIPAIQVEDGFQFEAWINIYDSKNIADIDFSKADVNTVYQFKPIFVEIHEIVFVDYKGDQLGETLIVKDGEKITASNLPSIPNRNGYTSKWDEQIITTKITETKVFTPIYEIVTFKVTFLDSKHGNEIVTSSVEYGSFAIFPECDLYQLRDKLYRFTGWKDSENDTFIENVDGNRLTNVYRNLTVYAVYEDSIEQPVLAIHIDGTTVTMSLCMPDGLSLYSINFSISVTTQKGICSINSASIIDTTSLNANVCKGDTKLHLDKAEWVTYNNKTKILDFVWGCGLGHAFNIDSNLISISLGLNNGAQMSDVVFTLETSSIVYGKDANISNAQRTSLVLWFY